MEQKEFEILASRIRPKLLVQARRYLQATDDAEDAVQEVLCKLWMIRTRLDQYRSIEALANTAIRNLCISRLRSTHEEATFDESAFDTIEDEAETEAEKEGQLQVLLHLIDSLPNAQQVVLRMKHIDGLEIADIARTLGCTEVAVRMNLSRARQHIKEQFFNRKEII